MRPSESITGDYDGDDENSSKRSGEGDHDDTKPTDRDNDSDNSSNSYYDHDDDSVRGFGHAAGVVERKAIGRLVRRYFAAANAADGASACTMIMSSIARTVAGDLGRAPGPPYARGTTCSAVVSKIFAHYHRQLAAHIGTLEVSSVRVRGSVGVVVLAFTVLPARVMHVVREQGVWRVEGLLDRELL